MPNIRLFFITYTILLRPMSGIAVFLSIAYSKFSSKIMDVTSHHF